MCSLDLVSQFASTATWRQGEQTRTVAKLIEELIDEGKGPKEKAVDAGLVERLGTCAPMFEALQWKDMVEEGQQAFESTLEILAAMCERAAAEGSATKAVTVFAAAHKLGACLDVLEAAQDGASLRQEQLEVMNVVVQMASLLADRPAANKMVMDDNGGLGNTMVETIAACARVKSLELVEKLHHLQPLVCIVLEAATSYIGDVGCEAKDHHSQNLKMATKKVEKCLGLPAGANIEKSVWWKSVGEKAPLNSVLEVAKTTILEESFAEKLTASYKEATQESPLTPFLRAPLVHCLSSRRC